MNPPPPSFYAEITRLRWQQEALHSTSCPVMEVDDTTERRQQVSPQKEPVFYRSTDTGEPARRFGGIKAF